MASKREVTVTINGKETVSEATGQADSALGGFVGKVPGWAKAVGVLAAAYAVVSKAIGAAKDYVIDSIASYDRFAASQTKLAAQSKLTGVSLAELNRLADEGRDRFGLSSVVANDAATTIAKYASRAGDATKANQLLAAALDLGAASGLNAAQTMEALEQGLRGQDEGFDKILGRNPSSLWKEYADANGLAVGKMTDTQKRMAELTAIMEAGNLVQGSYNDRLDSGAGAQDKLNNKLDEAKVAFGQAIQPLRVFVVQGLTTMVEVGGRVVLAIGRVANAIGVILTGAVEAARTGVGFLAIGIGKLTGSKDLENWGRDQSTAFSDFQAQLKKLEERYLTTGKTAEESAGRQVTATKTVAESVKATAETAEQAATRLNATLDAKLGKPMQVAIGLTEGAIASLGRAATDQLPTDQSQRFLTHMEGLVEASGKARDRIMGIGQPTRAGADNTRDMAREVEMVARGAVDAATSFGVIDDAAARSLNSAISIATAVGNMAKSGFSFAGVTGVIGGVASIVSSMMASDAERRRLLRENSIQLQRLREEGVSLSTRVSGEKVSKLTQALSGADLRQGSYFADKERSVLGQLAEFGLTIRDLEAVAAEYGIQGITKNGRLNDFNALRQLIEALSIGGGKVRVGQSFSEQLQFFRDSQRIDGVEGVGGLQGLIDFLRNVGGVRALDGIDVMSDPQEASRRLRGIFTQLSNGGIDSAAIGRLTGTQFSDLLMEIIGGLSSAASTQGSGTTPTTTGETPEDKAARERREARQKMFDDLELRRLNAEEVIANLRRGPMTEAVRNQIESYEQLIRSIRDEEEALRRRFRREDLTGDYGPLTPAPVGPASSVPVSAGGNLVVGGTAVPVGTVQEVIKSMDTGVRTILTEHTSLLTTIAAATESSAISLRSIDGKMDELIVVTAGQIEATDAKLEAMRRMAALERGQRPEFG